jgi:putative two-component system response regulator
MIICWEAIAGGSEYWRWNWPNYLTRFLWKTIPLSKPPASSTISASLSKPTIAYSGDEKKLYRSHPERGEELLKKVDLLKPVARIVRMHHEQPDGLGFPDGLTKDQIPVESQLVSAASIYDDLVHRRGIPLAAIPEQLQQLRGYQIDQPLVDLLLEYHMLQMEAEASARDRKISLDELKDGMMLSRDVLMKTGASVLPANMRVDNSAIDKLKNYLALGNISGSVFIYK